MTQVAELYEKKKEENRQNNLRYAALGVEFVDIDAAYIDAGVQIGKGVLIESGVTLRGDTVIGENCVIGQGCFLENARIGAGCSIDRHSEITGSSVGDGSCVRHSVVTESVVGRDTAIGPFAYLRPGSDLGDCVKIGDFVEIKNARIGNGTKVSHLTYVGDADLGKDINIGCGVVFVNYNGKDKHRSAIGDGAFIGCNVNLIAP
ncbi:MAG: hypothetical protein LBQ21_02145, partial [Clostridiales Family XIII bacterium]|nr:hypothetical protein [Clostridiales Family XIII bacterium]